MNLDELRVDCAIKQKKGLHIILASIVIWIAVFCIHVADLTILTKNLLTFCCTAPLLPIGRFSKQVESFNKFRCFIFNKSDIVFTDCNVDLSNDPGKDADGNCNNFWCASYAI